MSRLWNIGKSVLLSGGIISNGSLGGYIGNAARKALGMGLSELQDGNVQYFSKDKEILKRAVIQTASQLLYGSLRSYPRFIQYWEQRERDKYLETQSQSSIANKSGQYYQLISQQQAVAKKKNHTDTIVGRIVADYLELAITAEGNYYDSKTGKVESNNKYGLVNFVDLQPIIRIASKNNIVMTQVQGRDYTRKEYISGGDLEVSISGKITSKYSDVYPEAELSKFLKLMQFKGVIDCDNTILRQFNIEKLIVVNYSLPTTDCRNIQPYAFSCVAVEPSESIELKTAEQEVVDEAIKRSNKWMKIVNIGRGVVDPSSLLKWM